MNKGKLTIKTPHGSTIEIEKKDDVIVLQYKGRKSIVQTFANVDDLAYHLKKHVLVPIFGGF